MIKTLAIVGATGAVGRIVLEEVVSRGLQYENLRLLASARSAGTMVEVGGRSHRVELLCPDAFTGVDLAIASTPDEVAAECVPWAVDRGTTIIDESGYWRMDPSVPLVIPEVNADALRNHRGIISSPNCSTTQMVVALKPLYDAAGLKKVVVSTYQAVSGAGLAAQDELAEQSQAKLNNQTETPSIFPHPIAFNLIPQIGSLKHAGFTSEEMKMVLETHKIMGDNTIAITPTCVRVPVMVGHSEMIYCETAEPLSLEKIYELFAAAPGVTVIDDLAKRVYPMPRDCADKADVFVGRIRKDLTNPCGIAFWCVSDNLRKGAATNAVQIAERLQKMMAAV